MDKYKAVLTSGDDFTLNDKEFSALKKAWQAGANPIEIAGRLINPNCIVYVGEHEMSAHIERIEASNKRMRMIDAGQSKEVDKIEAKKKRLAQTFHINPVKVDIPDNPIDKNKYDEEGHPDYYTNKNGEKCYS